MANSSTYKVKIRLIAGLMLLLSLIIRVINSMGSDSAGLLYVVSVETTIFSVLIIMNLKRWLGSYLKVTLIFVGMFCLYMQGQLLLMSIGALDGDFLDGKFLNAECVDAIMDIHMYLSFFLFGLTLSRRYQGQCKYMADKKAIKIGYWVLVFSIPFYLLVIGQKLAFVALYGYASLYQDISLDAIPSGYKIISYFFLSGVFYLLYASERKSRHEKIALVLLIAHCAVNLIMGYRASTITPVLLLLYALRIKQFNDPSNVNHKMGKGVVLIIAVSAVLVLFVFPAVRETRNAGGLSTLSASDIFTQNALFETVHDMGKSLQTHIYTKELVPEQYPYRYGYTYIMNLSTALPNLFWARHPAEVYGSLGKWLTKIVDYDFYAFGGSLGYSSVAEAYINFGYFGMIFLPLLFGFVLMSIENKIEYYNSPIAYASFCIVAMYLVSYSRGEFADLVRGFFWYMLIPRLMYKYSK